ncbi:MAG: triose-phosphate isomerase [Chloroflexi bacterium]|nr:triose-phosphate isomerase [Chloroflexota bacterium]
MRLPIVAGNWKMHKTPAEAAEFARALIAPLSPFEGVERVVCPSFVAIPAVAEVLRGTPIKVGAQNVHQAPQGAYTGCVSVPMLQGLVEYVIIGHSEVRQYLCETDDMINAKAKALLAGGLKPIIAVGESLAQREAGETVAFVGGQVRAALEGIPAELLTEIVIAYEPIWAIGTGRNASPEDANETIRVAVRDVIAALYGEELAQRVRVQYGGSVKPENMAAYMEMPEIDGALVGGASLKLDEFVELVRLAAQAKRA